MARGAIVPTVSVRPGVKLVDEANGDATNGHYVANNGNTRLHIRNANGASTARTVTIRLAATVDGQVPAWRTQAIPAGETWVFGPYDTTNYGTQILIDVDNAELKIRAVQ